MSSLETHSSISLSLFYAMSNLLTQLPLELQVKISQDFTTKDFLVLTLTCKVLGFCGSEPVNLRGRWYPRLQQYRMNSVIDEERRDQGVNLYQLDGDVRVLRNPNIEKLNFLENFAQLLTLDLTGVTMHYRFTDTILGLLPRSLTDLSLRGLVLKQVIDLPLRSLRLIDCDFTSQTILPKTLTELDAISCRGTKPSLISDQIARCHNLTDLTADVVSDFVSWSKSLFQLHTSKLTAVSAQALPNFLILLTGGIVEGLPILPNLTYLDLHQVDRVDWSGFTALKVLDCDITSATPASFPPSLTELKLWGQETNFSGPAPTTLTVLQGYVIPGEIYSPLSNLTSFAAVQVDASLLSRSVTELRVDFVEHPSFIPELKVLASYNLGIPLNNLALISTCLNLDRVEVKTYGDPGTFGFWLEDLSARVVKIEFQSDALEEISDFRVEYWTDLATKFESGMIELSSETEVYVLTIANHQVTVGKGLIVTAYDFFDDNEEDFAVF